MAEVIRMPRMSDTMEEGNIVGWLKKVGDAVEPGDVLAEVETDKATMELENYHEGVLLYIGVKEGPVPVNAVLAVIGEEGEDYNAALSAAGGSNGAAAKEEKPAPAMVPEPVREAAAEVQPVQSTTEQSATSQDDSRTKASPLAKSIAKEAGIDLTRVQGSGDGGRIVKRDVEAALQQGTTASSASVSTQVAAPATTPVPGANYQDIPASQMRKVIARRLAESKFTAPHFYLGIDVDMSNAMEMRKQLNSISETRISFNDMIIKACAFALRKHPAVNSSWMGDFIRQNHDVNIGVAVAVDEGLLVPVVMHADRKGYAEINQEVAKLAGLARERKLQPQQMQGNTFTISNLGMFDISEFTAIINPPDACILAVGSIRQVPVVKNGELAVGNVMKLTMSCDHRVVDGDVGAQFLATLKQALENPLSIML